MTSHRISQFDLCDFVRAGSYTDLKGCGTLDASHLESRVDRIEGEGPRILIRDFGPWRIEFIFDEDDHFVADQIKFQPEAIDLDPDDEPEAVADICAFAWWSTIAAAASVSGVTITAVHGTGDPEDELIVFLENGVNLHYQPMEGDHLLSLASSRLESERDRQLIRRIHPRLR